MADYGEKEPRVERGKNSFSNLFKGFQIQSLFVTQNHKQYNV